MTGVLECVEIPPVVGEAQGAIIWLHGLGASGHDFEPIAPLLELHDIRFIFPHAPEQPVSLNRGYVMPSWYDIRTLEAGPNRESEADIRETALRIEALITREIERGLMPSDIVLAGFSQGGAIALHVGLRYEETLKGIMALSTYMVMPDTLGTEALEANENTPVLFCHGTQDDVVLPERGQHAYELLKSRYPGRDVKQHTFPMAHEVCPEEIGTIKAWLHERFYGA